MPVGLTLVNGAQGEGASKGVNFSMGIQKRKAAPLGADGTPAYPLTVGLQEGLAGEKA